MSSSIRHSRRVILIILIFLLGGVFALSSCVEPSPFYGTWADNKGSSISFFDDNSFSAKIYEYGIESRYAGNYSVLMNVLTLSRSDGSRMVTELDIRGNIMYLDWTTSGDDKPVSLKLYKTSN